MLPWVLLASKLLTHADMCHAAHTGHVKVVAERVLPGEPTPPAGDPETDAEDWLCMMEGDPSPRRRRTLSESSDGGFSYVPEQRWHGTEMPGAGTPMGGAAGTAGGGTGMPSTGMPSAGTPWTNAAETAGTGSAGTDRPAGIGTSDKLPEPCTGDRSEWPEWAFVARAFLVAQGCVTPAELQIIEGCPYPIQFYHLNQERLARSQAMYYKLVQMVRGHALRVIQPVTVGNGFEAWRMLACDMQELDTSQSVGLMNEILKFTLQGTQDYEYQLSHLDQLVERYRRQHGEAAVPDELLRAVVIRGATEPLRGHLQLQSFASYRELKTAILRYRHAQRLWNLPDDGLTDADTAFALSGKGKGKGKAKMKGKAKGADEEIRCFNCRGFGHTASQCPSPRKDRSDAWYSSRPDESYFLQDYLADDYSSPFPGVDNQTAAYLAALSRAEEQGYFTSDDLDAMGVGPEIQ